eukprot:121351-Rhodomonas_salina.5
MRSVPLWPPRLMLMMGGGDHHAHALLALVACSVISAALAFSPTSAPLLIPSSSPAAFSLPLSLATRKAQMVSSPSLSRRNLALRMAGMDPGKEEFAKLDKRYRLPPFLPLAFLN